MIPSPPAQLFQDPPLPAAAMHALLGLVSPWMWIVGTLGLLLVLTATQLVLRMRRLQRAQESLRENEARLRDFFDHSGDLIQCLGPDGRFLDVNRTWRETLGYSEEEARSMHMLQIIHPDCRAHCEAIFGRLMRGEDVGTVDAEFVAKDGRRVVLEGKLSVRGGPQGALSTRGIFRDVTEDRARRNRLREQEEDLTAVLESSPEAIGVVNTATGCFEKINAQTELLLGRSRAELLAVGPRGVSPEFQPDGRLSSVSAKEKLDEALRGGRPVFEWTHTDARGTAIPCEVRLVALPAPRHHLVRFSVTDITARKEAAAEARRLKETLELLVAERTAELSASETRLRGSFQLLQSVVENVPIRVFWKDVSSRYLGCNSLFAKDAGFTTPDEVIGKTDFEMAWKAQADLYREDDQAVIGTLRTKLHYEEPQTTPDGRIIWLRTSKVPLHDERNQVVGVLGIYEDITERKQAEAVLIETRDRLTALFEGARDAVLIADADTGIILDANAAAEKLLLRPKDHLVGRHQTEIHPPQLAESYKELFATHSHGLPSAMETVVLRSDGRHVPVEISASVVTLSDGRRLVQGLFRDLTERRHAEQALAESEAQLRQAQKLEAIGQLAGGVAHDFNNILAATMMHLGLLQMSENLDAETRQALKDLEEQARRAASLTSQLLMFSRRSVLSIKPLDVNDVVANLLKMLNRLIGEQIELRFDSGRGVPQVDADAGMLEQMLVNLVVNARDAMPKGGRITLSTSGVVFDPAQAAPHSARRPGPFVCLAVSDTGCGIDPETLKRIFEPFFTTKEVGKGTGLGLATVHGIAAQHRGWVEVETRENLGSTFRIYLPARTSADPKPDAHPVPASLPRGAGEQILLVEDDPRVRQIAGRLLKALGYRILEAANGTDAMKLWQAHSGDLRLLLTDMVMPEGMTGLELAERLLAQKPSLKVIVSSGYSAEIAQAGAPTKGGIVYLPKPYAPEVLAETVSQCLLSAPAASAATHSLP